MHEFSFKPEFYDDVKCLKCCMSEKNCAYWIFKAVRGT